MNRHHPLKNMRNIGIFAHIDAGKTTTTERILYYTGITHKIGEVHEGTAVMDWMSQEQERGITITAAATACNWKDTHINLIDTPGHVDFTMEVERCLRILDGAVFVLDAKEGVEAQTEAVWKKADYYSVPRAVFVNKMDVIAADFNRCVSMLNSRFAIKSIPIQLPIGVEKDFQGVISLLDMKATYFEGDLGERVHTGDIPAELIEQALAMRQTLIETLSEFDDELLIKYLEGNQIEDNDLLQILRRETIRRTIVPVLCGSAYRNKGVQTLLDAISNFLPSPEDRPIISGKNIEQENIVRSASDNAPFSSLVFKIVTDPYVGKLHYLRIYSGKVAIGQNLFIPSKNKSDRLHKILQMHANSRTEVSSASTGDIIAAIGLKHAITGDTLCDPQDPIQYESMQFPEPVMSIAIESLTPSDADKLSLALNRLGEEDPTLRAITQEDTGQTLLYGMGELHLEIILERLTQEFGVIVNKGKPQVTYKETITEAVSIEYTLDKKTEHHTLYAEIALTITPSERGSGNTITLNLEAVSQQNKQFIQDSITQALQSGILGGYEVVDLTVEVTKAYAPHDAQAEIAYKAVAAQGLYEALRKAKSTLLEPIFALEVHVPHDYIGDITEDIAMRRGTVLAIDSTYDGQIVKAIVPLTKLFGYATTLRSRTKGRGHYTMLFSHYDTV